ncbi:lipase family protein [Chitinophaga agrisoli]|uniref:Lipase family protein n=1 Tax=Chitinophaga agrisoli TaxID=2607653 RepID=A0A5B2VWG8_9BACT|nr:lipase family protein [Chitinophaga agrisoli]KAA2243415.1 lipase family protein [Chitinophaga agrisoli]
MRILKRLLAAWIYSILLYCLPATAQKLQPGFDPKEYEQLLRVTALQGDTPWTKLVVPYPDNCRLIYRSPVVGMLNRWDLWLHEDHTAIISIRGTTGTAVSWLANFYAGMIPAMGTLQLNDSTRFPYKLARDSAAYVHAGWTLGMASIAPDVVSKIKEYHKKGIRNFLIVGHSQGAAIAFLLRSYLEYLDDPDFPRDILIKTYCSAAPKPGNLYYAYDYDFITRDGWGYRVINPRDWVPETPFSIQTTNDYNSVNPFVNLHKGLKKQRFFIRLAVNYMYGRLDRSSKRASRRMQRVLGKLAYKQVHKTLAEYGRPDFVNSHNYTPAGSPIILYPQDGYDAKFPFDGKNLFVHHMVAPYVYLLKQIYKID